MKINFLEFFAELERLAAACPWDPVQLHCKREPEGAIEFTSYISDNEQFGFPYACGSGPTPAEAVDNLLKGSSSRDPSVSVEKKVEALRRQIAKLQAVTIGLPPYRPNRELANGTAIVPDPVVEV